MPDLEPCRLCGGKAQIWRTWRLLDGVAWGSIAVCTSSGCPATITGTMYGQCTTAASAEKATRNAWNAWAKESTDANH